MGRCVFPFAAYKFAWRCMRARTDTHTPPSLSCASACVPPTPLLSAPADARAHVSQVDYAILFGMSIYDAGKSRIAVAQSALETASENMRAAREKVTSALHTDSLSTFYDAREAYKAKLSTYLATMKERGEKLPTTIAQMIATNVTYLREAIVSLKDQPTGAQRPPPESHYHHHYHHPALSFSFVASAPSKTRY